MKLVQEDLRLKMLYALPIMKDVYGLYRVVVMLVDENGFRYVWVTNDKSKGLSVMSDKEYHKVSFCTVEGLDGGDLRIERLRILK